MNQIKLTMEMLAKLKEKKVWDSIYIKCHLCGEFKHISEATLLESPLEMEEAHIEGTGVFATVKQISEVICNDCLKLMPESYYGGLEI